MLILFVLMAGTGLAEEEKPVATPQDTIVMGPMTIDKANKQVRIKVRTAIDKGLLEYLLVEDGGKDYESAFKAEGYMPSELNFALLLLGTEPLDFMQLLELAQDADGEKKLLATHKKSLVSVSLIEEGKEVGLPRVILDREGKGSQLLWVHTGSRFTNDGRYLGDVSLSHIAIWPDESAVINLFSSRGNPYRGDFGFVMNESNARLQKDQEYQLVLTPYRK